MFGWFRPTCPCDPAAKSWVEGRLKWLSQQFGIHLLLERPIILPTSEFFPDPWDGTPKAVRAMFHRVCGYMGVDPSAVEMRLFTDTTSGASSPSTRPGASRPVRGRAERAFGNRALSRTNGRRWTRRATPMLNGGEGAGPGKR